MDLDRGNAQKRLGGIVLSLFMGIDWISLMPPKYDNSEFNTLLHLFIIYNMIKV